MATLSDQPHCLPHIKSIRLFQIEILFLVRLSLKNLPSLAVKKKNVPRKNSLNIDVDIFSSTKGRTLPILKWKSLLGRCSCRMNGQINMQPFPGGIIHLTEVVFSESVVRWLNDVNAKSALMYLCISIVIVCMISMLLPCVHNNYSRVIVVICWFDAEFGWCKWAFGVLKVISTNVLWGYDNYTNY